MPPIEPLLTPEQLGERLGVEELEVLERIRGDLPALKFRGRWRIRPGDLSA